MARTRRFRKSTKRRKTGRKNSKKTRGGTSGTSYYKNAKKYFFGNTPEEKITPEEKTFQNILDKFNSKNTKLSDDDIAFLTKNIEFSHFQSLIDNNTENKHKLINLANKINYYSNWYGNDNDIDRSNMQKNIHSLRI